MLICIKLPSSANTSNSFVASKYAPLRKVLIRKSTVSFRGEEDDQHNSRQGSEDRDSLEPQRYMPDTCELVCINNGCTMSPLVSSLVNVVRQVCRRASKKSGFDNF